jgi:hypothetical protein
MCALSATFEASQSAGESVMTMRSWREPTSRAASLMAGAIAFALYVAPGSPTPSNDTRALVYMPHALLLNGSSSFDPQLYPFMFRWNTRDNPVRVLRIDTPDALQNVLRKQTIVLRGPKYYLVPSRDQTRFVSTFGVLPGLLSMPLIVALALPAPAFALSAEGLSLAAWLTAALLCAASVAFVYSALLALGHARRNRWIAIAAYALGTSVFSLSSRTLWQQTAALFFIAAALPAAVRVLRHGSGAARCGLALALAMCCRPTAALLALAIGGFVLVERRSLLFRYCLPLVAAGVGIGIYNASLFGSPLTSPQLLASASIARLRTGSAQLFQTPLWLGAGGLLFSPARGLFVYSPIMLFSLSSLYPHDPRDRRFFWALWLGIAALWCVAFTWFDWWGGYCYAARPLTESLPLLALALSAGLERWSAQHRPWQMLAVAACLAWSIALHALGAFAYEPLGWNEKAGQSIDDPRYRQRLWAWSDAPFIYYAKDLQASVARRQMLAALWIRDRTL